MAVQTRRELTAMPLDVAGGRRYLFRECKSAIKSVPINARPAVARSIDRNIRQAGPRVRRAGVFSLAGLLLFFLSGAFESESRESIESAWPTAGGLSDMMR